MAVILCTNNLGLADCYILHGGRVDIQLTTMYSGTAITRHSVGKKQCVRLQRLSDY